MISLNWTFMELKSRSAAVRRGRFSFELNLYGIEIIVLSSADKWEETFELNLYGIEIVLYCSVVLLCWRFELNLYGIEMLIILTALSCSEGLNWTFMELKFLSARSELQDKVFELNLYGIEIWRHEEHQCAKWVWIEPLWNWNLHDALRLLPCAWGLNWTFMELKSEIETLMSVFRAVWIEPLWNWNI